MKAVEAILKIKALFEDMPKEEVGKEEPKQEEVKVEMSEYQLADGTKIMISSLEVGGMVELEDGTPAPDGEHELADGQKIVTEGGVIKEIKTEEKEPAVEVEIEAEKKKDEMQSEFNKKFEDLKSENEKLKNELSEMKSKMKEGFSHVVSLVESIAKVPQAEPTQKPSSFKFATTEDMKFERLSKYRDAILKTKNK
jgi:uncharacterized protein with von Willebrand factor type A (vWA) domain